jgi:hypothetical protein
MAWNKMLLGAVMCVLAACNNDMNVGDTGSDNDSGASDVAAMDSSTQDTATTDTHSSNDVVLITDTGTGTDGGGEFGTCGMSTNTCICMCGNDQTCQQGCFTDRACQMCLVNAQAMCCPTEANALGACAMAAQTPSDAGPACAATDNACILMRCMSEYNAFQSCVNTASASDTTCQGHLAQCLGHYPVQCM